MGGNGGAAGAAATHNRIRTVAQPDFASMHGGIRLAMHVLKARNGVR